MSKTELKKHIRSLDREDLEKFVLDMYSSNKDIKEYIDFRMNPDFRKKLDHYKSVIRKEFFPERGYPKLRYSICRSAVADFRALKPEPKYLAELLLYIPLCATEFGGGKYLPESFFDSDENAFRTAMEFIRENHLQSMFQEDIYMIWKYSYTCGYMFTWIIEDVYSEYTENEGEKRPEPPKGKTP